MRPWGGAREPQCSPGRVRHRAPPHVHTKEIMWGHNRQDGPCRHRGVSLPAFSPVVHTSAPPKGTRLQPPNPDGVTGDKRSGPPCTLHRELGAAF